MVAAVSEPGIDLAEKLAGFTECWAPRIVGRYNDNDIMVVKVEGAFVWHDHPETDDFFLCLEGAVDIEMHDKTVCLSAGQFYVVPKGVAHRPVARGHASLLLIEPRGTPNTGDPATAVHKSEV